MNTVPESENYAEDAQWHGLANSGLANAYSEDEPDYSSGDLSGQED